MINKKICMLLKVIVVLIVITYTITFPITSNLSKIESLIVLGISIIALRKARNNILLFIMFFFIAYTNYSVVVGEYLLPDFLTVPMNQVKTEVVYGITLRTLLLFMSIITVLYNGKEIDLYKYCYKVKNNYIIFYTIICTLVLILIFGIKRENIDSYSVMITPMFEYSKIMFLFAYYYSGRVKNRKILLFTLIVVFILFDFYYGGRITSLQILILLFLTNFSKNTKIKYIFIGAIILMFINGMVATYRGKYNIRDINIIKITDNIFSNLFVFDTATYAYYTSATHIAASNISNADEKIKSFICFIKAITFKGSELEFVDVSSFIRADYFHNYGGGFIPTHFYYWFGWYGVIVIAIIIVIFINSINMSNSNFGRIVMISFIVMSPRWYLYSPNQLFRAVLILVPIIYISTYVFHIITIKNIDKLYKR